ncbi:uncharacterized protein LOC128300635 isoform X2 [Anopheles moucheti]|uniref:uncharacterized protein LOC128300635 isoform X2 n=1 Tax=Anopheles moucheti TaxID=186751 RepID=UPI0022F01100|nr:uncharacterized protein LOC128300635 isoform X2 [Anopheles moucheti]
MLINSAFGRTFLFLTNLAWKNRVALPALIMVGCMVLNYRGEIEINIHTERIALHDLPNRQQQQQQQAGAFGGIAIDHLEDFSDDDELDEDDLYDYFESDEEDDEFVTEDEEDEDDDTYDEEDDDEDGERMLNGTIRLNWYTTLNIHNARR